MDLPSVQWQEHVSQKWTGLDPEFQEHFTSLTEIDDVFKYALNLTTRDDLDYLHSLSASYPVQKDTQQAANCRERGNGSFKNRDYTAAALHYSQGICFAPQSSEQLSLCYANRSAALYHLQHYQECLDDIAKARKNGYPFHLVHKLTDRRTLCLKHLSGGQQGKGDPNSQALKNNKGPRRSQPPSAEHITSWICPQATVSFSLEKGRHLVAAQRIAAGEMILSDRPYSCVLIPGMQEVGGKSGEQDTGELGTEHRCCHRCLTETLSPVPCEGCSYGRYCSTGCQQDAWGEHHRWECPLGADLLVLGVMSQLALRVALKAGLKNIQMAREPIRDEHTKSEPRNESSETYPCHANQLDPSTSYYGDSYKTVFHLHHLLNRQSPALRFLSAVTVATLALKLSKAGPLSWDLSVTSTANCQSADEEGGNAGQSDELWLMGSAVLRHVLQLRCNTQAIVMLKDTGPANSPVQSSREIRVASAIFPTLSLLNHSCCPNTSLVFSTGANVDPSVSAHLCESVDEHGDAIPGVAVTVRAASDIAAGQEILHCYGPHSSRMVTQERQRLLLEQYYFLCQCKACTVTQEEAAEGREQKSGSGVSQSKSGLLCCKCKGSLNKSSVDKGAAFICSQSPCTHRTSSSEVSLRLQEIRVVLKRAGDLMERDRPDEALGLLNKVQFQAGQILAETHPLQGELADAMARACATMGDWNNAASHLERSAVSIGSQYGDDSIELGQQLFKLAQLHFNGGARGPALSVIPKVRRLLCLHRGSHCLELQELQAMEDCLRR
ncbi:SET and MYND domain-containing protein 4 [Solea senegalensis]|uniref:Protein-lysine N-methyltransferase SMYD4 n=1 Tax=Solea senegalensis TaxID=28829 RepID=A0AAV6SJ11_SOLSE|nr:SET and MYND domain-containing protein 4 [Solea senegalensis]KAG7517056.1 SET and MYND domain-containing protein 4 [Solea senegalensis]KAG7517057.1 SET and MYND domain-containing protein 4 [Solea senegalensis]